MIITAESSDGIRFIDAIITKEPDKKPSVGFWKNEDKMEFMDPHGEVSADDIQLSDDATLDDAYNVVERYLTGKGFKIVSVDGRQVR